MEIGFVGGIGLTITGSMKFLNISISSSVN